MLILTRRAGESIMMGKDPLTKVEITITLLAIKGNQARIGITAGKEMNIVRSELLPIVRSELPKEVRK